MNLVFWEKLFSSIIVENTYILISALLMFGLLLKIHSSKKQLLKTTNHDSETKAQQLKLRRLFELFQTGISIFPLLGMFGTVKSLLSLDFSEGLADSQLHFFDALTSTAWGILFAILFKIVNAWLAPAVDLALDNDQDQRTETGSHFRKKDSQ